MPIEHSPHGATTMTGESISFFALIAQAKAARLEQKGIKMHRRGPALWKVYREHYNIPGTGKKRATQEQVCKWMEARIEELRPQQKHITTDAAGQTIVSGGEL